MINDFDYELLLHHWRDIKCCVDLIDNVQAIVDYLDDFADEVRNQEVSAVLFNGKLNH